MPLVQPVECFGVRVSDWILLGFYGHCIYRMLRIQGAMLFHQFVLVG